MAEIHKSAIVEDGARIGSGVRIGPYSIIERDVVLEDDVVIHPMSSSTGTRRSAPARRSTRSFSIGGPPQDTSFLGEATTAWSSAELHHPRA
jgi:UDP-N-acetylglucosamine acyltransferase